MAHVIILIIVCRNSLSSCSTTIVSQNVKIQFLSMCYQFIDPVIPPDQHREVLVFSRSVQWVSSGVSATFPNLNI